MKKYLSILALLVVFVGVYAFGAANDMGQNQSVIVRRPQPNMEFVKFQPTNSQVANITWTNNLNFISGKFLTKYSSVGGVTVPSNTLYAATSGNVLTISWAGPWYSGGGGTTNGYIEVLCLE